MNLQEDFPNMAKWWLESPDEILSFVYWLKKQTPPIDKDKRDLAWRGIVTQLHRKHPAPTSIYKKLIGEVNENKMIKLAPLIKEREETYFKTFTAAVQYAESYTKKKGYEIDEDDWAQQITLGRGKPGVGKTFKASIELIKNGKPSKKNLQMQVYGMDSGNYELTFYIS